MRTTAIYMRVSTSQQKTDSQKDDLVRWVKSQSPVELGHVRWYEDHYTGKVMDRPGWNKLKTDMSGGDVQRLVCWRLDRLGRTAKGLVTLFDDLDKANIHLVSIKDSVDLSTPAGKLIAHVLASVAAYETEVRGERVRAGQKSARDKAKEAGIKLKWGGRAKGQLNGDVLAQVDLIYDMRQRGMAGNKIAKMVGRCNQTVYNVLKAIDDGTLTPKPLPTTERERDDS